MAWRDNLQPAIFRGVPFFVEQHEAELGRRVALHEFPLRDRPYAEDLGRKSRTLSIEAYVLGADYMSDRNALVRACELPGAGRLVHPYLGGMQVTVVGCKLRESTAEGGVARFTLEVVEAGAAEFPGTSADTAAAVAATADAASSAVQTSFAERHVVVRRPAFVTEAAQGIFSQALGGIKAAAGKVRGVAGPVAELNRSVEAANRDLVTLIFTPASAAQALAGSIRALVRNVATTPREALSLVRPFYTFGSLLPPVATTTPSRRTQATNQAQLLQLVRVVAAAEGARAASAVGWSSYQEATAARDELVAVMDDAMLAGADDATFTALRALRAALVSHIAARGANLARVAQWTPAATVPALVVAQRLYADATREPELLARNGVRHPLFVPGAQPLEVLRDAA